MKNQWTQMLHGLSLRRIGLGAAMAVVATAVLTAGFAALISNQVIPENTMEYAAVGVLVLSAFLSAGFSVGRSGNLLEALAVGGAYLLVLLGINAVGYNCSVKRLGITVLAVLGSSIAAGLVFLPRGGKHKRRRRR